MVMFRCRNSRIPIAGLVAEITVLPTSSNITYSDHAGTWAVDASKARATRPIVEANNFQYAAPNARVSISVTVDEPTYIEVNVQYTGLVTLDDPYNDLAYALIDNGQSTLVTCPIARVTDHPVSPAKGYILVPTGTHTVAIAFPTLCSMDFVNFILPDGVTLNAAPTRPTKKYLGFGDSRMHGVGISSAIETYLFNLANTNSAQSLNLGYGSRRIEPTDATVAGGFAADAAIYVAGINNFVSNGAIIADIQSDYELIITNYRAAAIAAGKPTSELIMVSDFWSTSDSGGGGPWDGNSPTLQDFRDAMDDAVTAVADAYTTFVSGNTGGMPTGTDDFPDGVHPNDQGAATIEAVLEPLMP